MVTIRRYCATILLFLSKNVNVTINYNEWKYRYRNCVDQKEHNVSFCAHVCVIIQFFLWKLFDLSNNDDIEAVLDILDLSDADFPEDDDADEIWTALNVNTEAASSNDSISSEDLFAFPNDQISAAESNSIEQLTTSKKPSISKSNTLNWRDLWKNISFQNTELPATSVCQNDITSKTPLEYFKSYFPESHYEDVVKYTKMYVMGKRGEEVRYVP